MNSPLSSDIDVTAIWSEVAVISMEQCAELRGGESDIKCSVGSGRIFFNRVVEYILSSSKRDGSLNSDHDFNDVYSFLKKHGADTDDAIELMARDKIHIDTDLIGGVDLRLEHIYFNADVLVTGKFCRVFFYNCLLHGFVSINLVDINSLTMIDCVVGGYINVFESKRIGEVHLQGCRVYDGVFIVEAFIAHSFHVVASQFYGTILLINSKFDGECNFIECSFYDIDFSDSEFLCSTIYERTTFYVPPIFFGSTLHEGTFWRQVLWPSKPNSKQDANQFVGRYERLKLEMARLNRHEDEMFFFKKELECRRVELGWFKGLPIAFYGLLSDYGRSYFRPANGLLLTIAAGTVAWLSHFGETKFWKALGFSLAHTFAIFNFRRELLNPDELKHLSYWLTVISAGQTVLGVLFLFLLGLALRNHFRMK